MAKNKKSKAFWMYTIILFTVALVLILLSLAMTDYKKANENYESKVQSLQTEYDTLYEENTKNQVTISALEEKNRQLSEQIENRKSTDMSYADAVESIYIADGLCDEGRYTDAKTELDKIDETILKEQVHARYMRVKQKMEANLD